MLQNRSIPCNRFIAASLTPYCHIDCNHRVFICQSTNPPPSVTRTHKATDRDHAGLANGTAAPEEHLPRYFGKSGFTDNNPSGTKKQGGGKGNW